MDLPEGGRHNTQWDCECCGASVFTLLNLDPPDRCWACNAAGPFVAVADLHAMPGQRMTRTANGQRYVPPQDAPEVADLVKEFIEIVIQWDIRQPDRPGADVSAANRAFDRIHGLGKQLRTTDDGRRGISGLMTYPMVAVRLNAATYSLEWSSDAAVAVLREIEAGPGLYAVTARYTLRAFHEGTLDLDC
jgi:hypothetical protein